MSRQGGAKRTRQGGVSSGSRASIALVPEHPLVRFRDQIHRDRFVELMGKKVTPTRFLDRNLMISLGLDAMLLDVFNGIGMPAFYGMRELTYESLTLEFLSSYKFTNTTTDSSITFRLLNREVIIGVADIARYFEILRDGSEITMLPDPFNVTAFWSSLTGIHPRMVNIDRMTTNAIQHPGIRMVLRTIVGTFHARPDVSKINQLDVMLLGSYLNPFRQAPVRLDLGFFLAFTFGKAARGKFRSHEVGGLVTWLAKKHFELDAIEGYAPATAEVPLIDENWLVNYHHWLQRMPQRRWKWQVSTGRWLILPCSELAPLLPLPESSPGRGVPSYTIPDELTPGHATDPPPQVPVSEAARSVPTFPSVYPLPPMGPTSTENFDPNSFFEQRFIHLNLDHQMNEYGWHNFLINQGAIPPTGPHPSYWTGIDTYPGTIFRDHGVDPSSYGSDYGASYGGIAGQYLSQFGTGTTGYSGNFSSGSGRGVGGPSSHGGDVAGSSSGFHEFAGGSGSGSGGDYRDGVPGDSDDDDM